jgi:MFS family permease
MTQQNPLRAYSILEIVDRTFRLYRDHIVVYAGVVAAVVVPLTLIEAVIDQSYMSRISSGDFFAQREVVNQYNLVISLYRIVSAIIQGVFVSGTLAYIASEHHLGRKVTINDAVNVLRDRYMLLGFSFFLFYVLLIILGMVSALTVVCLVGFVGFALLIYAAVGISSYIAPVIMLENVDAMQGIQRAWGLAKARFWPLVGLLVILGLITYALGLGVGLIQQLVSQSAAGLVAGSFTIAVLLQIILAVAVGPIAPIALTLMYFDTRIRLEGLDIALQAVERSDARPTDVMSPDVNPAINGRDMRNIALILGVLVILVLILGATADILLDMLTQGGFNF